ncbi:MAG: undecaprenyl-diphosphatase [Burkholderiaceae bacterium]
MNAFDQHLFLLLNAPAHVTQWQITLAFVFAEYFIFALPILLIGLWIRGTALDRDDRDDLVHATVTVGTALLLGQLVSHVWPHARPFMQHIGTNFLPHVPDASFPSDHMLVFWGLGLGFLVSQRLSWLTVPLLAVGLLVGWSRIFLGVHFPLDIAGALPVAALAALISRAAAGVIDRAISIPAQRLYWYVIESRLRTGNKTHRQHGD